MCKGGLARPVEASARGPVHGREVRAREGQVVVDDGHKLKFVLERIHLGRGRGGVVVDVYQSPFGLVRVEQGESVDAVD